MVGQKSSYIVQPILPFLLKQPPIAASGHWRGRRKTVQLKLAFATKHAGIAPFHARVDWKSICGDHLIISRSFSSLQNKSRGGSTPRKTRGCHGRCICGNGDCRPVRTQRVYARVVTLIWRKQRSRCSNSTQDRLPGNRVSVD